MTVGEGAHLIRYSMLVGLVLTFASLIYISEELYVWVDGGAYPIGRALTYGFPFGWIAFGGPSVFFSPLDPVAFLFDISFWAIVTYFTLRYIAPKFMKLIFKNQTIKLVNLTKRRSN